MTELPAQPQLSTEQAVASEDRLALYGYGLFETILVTGRGPCFLARHYERMKRGSELLALDMPSLSVWSGLIATYLSQVSVPPTPFALRLTLSGGAPAQALAPSFLLSSRLIGYSQRQYEDGFALTLLPTRRNESSPLCRIKSTNYLENLLAKQEAIKRGFDEGLWCNSLGELAEGTLSNLFFVREGQLFTPSPACGCLPGTRRALVLELAETLGLAWQEGAYQLDDLKEASEVFLTNSLLGIMPVNRLDEHRFRVTSGSVSRRLALALQRRIQAEPALT
ncbi:Aminotransferase class IV [Acididesulfobacillus acetoxydans]|uniref:Aminotransferase class IV n=1 Tax=Acididesulfobacillus acetoxydans TaxID=1561005 RepID=A0A8S0VWS3_9FIRM|nr:aminotransferase class IV [Acididesulfobacillus acetoxydans]CAA7601173.1 Aminotransferase class IV [Acididesulfobacillus acetoxydans]CEJ08548.1 Branched-chain amino acid aminotransferase/4-amino-4-deoxychorismate lyase [Acididesulfobacillus acetoxydans]